MRRSERKLLVLDLDETLVHASARAGSPGLARAHAGLSRQR
ncbi:hypothetical protein [Stenotrophomonas maltophilia]